MIVSAILFYFIFRVRVKRAKEKAQKTKLELQAIQAQLNPHFMFNALGSIQYLVNNNDKENANQYLTEFSSLLRNSLYNNEQEMVPLSKELQTMDSYIRLEKLRFNFQYQLNVAQNIQPENISIPTLLIQPMIENAIKHGISSLKENGVLLINIEQKTKDLVVEIKDNGKGFDTTQPSKGFGIKLVKERIEVLNKQGYKIKFSIVSNNGTSVRFVFENWV
ncbi:hypothetical protein A9P82_06595 [Arachidicoccus ginsenosidimutans]|uniref:sensor histidine kinase n=1 Tax=Arachidicoccus sp. BS20 TaxID=1850526 RepID=UPI0007F15A0F|nr:histidine kinase [Arachidicoccus sp. BS20]ANI88991.1 hypothetical protein A9P82_06595 [Arachidicoccus sp. BS20]